MSQTSWMVRLTVRCVLSLALLAHCCSSLTVGGTPKHSQMMIGPPLADADARV